jgi:ADP-heptose:LPS heptosyltransferase
VTSAPRAGRGRRARRRLKRRFYRLLTRAYRALLGTPPACGPVPPSTLRRVLVVRHDAIGDMVVTTPLLSYLRAVAPQAELDVVASPRNAALLDGDPRVSRVFVNDGTRLGWLRCVRALRARGYDTVVSPILGRHQREGLFAALVAPRGARRITGWRHPQFVGLFTHNVRIPAGLRHMAERLLYVAQSAVRDPSAPCPPRAPDLRRFPMSLARDAAADARADAFLRAHAPGPFVAVNAWAAEPWRRLAHGQAVAIVAELARRHPGVAFVLTPPPGHAPEAEAIAGAVRDALGAARAAAGPVVVRPPSPSLGDLVALLRRAAVVVTPDTANVHVAAAAGRPVVGFYTPRSTVVERWLPLGVPHRAVVLADGRPVADMPPADAVAAFEALWEELDGVIGRA